jgi:hypothetical protein
MKFFQYIRYFFLSINNRGLLFTLKLLFFEPYYERKLRIQTLAIENLEGMNVLDDDFENNHHYQGASYYVLHQVFTEINKFPHQYSIIDYGCGKGRAMIVAAKEGFKNVAGIDLAEELCVSARKNIGVVAMRFPATTFSVVHANATAYQAIDEFDTFYFFNPFGRQVMSAVVTQIKLSQQRKPRVVYIIYINPQFFDCFIHEGFEIAYELRSKKYTEAMILKLG